MLRGSGPPIWDLVLRVWSVFSKLCSSPNPIYPSTYRSTYLPFYLFFSHLFLFILFFNFACLCLLLNIVVAGHGKMFFFFWEKSQGNISNCLCQEGVVFPLSPTDNNLHCHTNLTTPVRHSIPTLEGKRVYQILHVLHSYMKQNVNQSLVCSSKWLSLPRADVTAWCWTQIRRATKMIFTSSCGLGSTQWQ